MLAGQLPGMYFPLGKEKNQQGLSRGKGLDSPSSGAHPALGGRKDNLREQGVCGVSLCWSLGGNGNYWDVLWGTLEEEVTGCCPAAFSLKDAQEWAGSCVNQPRTVSQASCAASLLHIHPASPGSEWRWIEDPGSCLDLHFSPEPGVGRIFSLPLDGNISKSTILNFCADTTKNQEHEES